MQRLLDRARVLAEAPAGQLAPSLGKTRAGSRELAQREKAILDLIGERFQKVTDDSELRSAIAWAQTVIDSVTHSRRVDPESPREFRKRVCLEYRGKPVSEIVYRERISVTYARQIRSEGFDGRVFRPRDGVEVFP